MPRRSRNDDAFSKGFAAFVAILLMPVFAVVNGALLAKLWEWFIADQFGVRHLSVVQAIGVALVVGFLTYTHVPEHPDTDPLASFAEGIARWIVRIAFTFVSALLLVQFA